MLGSDGLRQLLIADVALVRGVATARQVAYALQGYWERRDDPDASVPTELGKIADVGPGVLREIVEQVDHLVEAAGGDASVALERHGGLDRSIHAALKREPGELTRILADQGVTVGSLLRPVAEDRYVDFEVAGEGGMGLVYAALDTELNRTVAFKMVRPDVRSPESAPTPADPITAERPSEDTPASRAFETLKTRFLQEAWITSGLEHPGIVPVYELGETPKGVPYYTMRFVRGRETFASAIDGLRDASFEDRLRLFDAFLRLCDAIAYAHSRGVVHRDLKPANVALGEFGEVVVLDWGLAKLEGRPDLAASRWQDQVTALREATELKTVGGMGTPGYMAPEAARGTVDAVDARSDVFSLGVILYEILTGRLPHEFTTISGFLRVIDQPPTSVRDVNAEVPASLSDLVDRALAPQPEDRIASAGALAEALRGWRMQRTVDSEVENLLRDAEGALAAAEEASGEVRLRQADRAAAALVQATTKRPESVRAGSLGERVEALRQTGIREREEAARAEALRRVRRRLVVGAVAALALLAAGAFVVSGVLNEQRKQAVVAAERARAAERDEADTRDRAEDLINYMVFDLRDQLSNLGRLELLAGVTNRIEQYFASVPPGRQTPRSQRQHAVALNTIGDVLKRQGDLPAALQAYRTSLAIHRAQAEADVDSALYQKDVARLHAEIRSVLVDQGDLEGALRHAQESLQLRRRRLQQHGTTPGRRVTLASGLTDLGDIHHERGDLPDAMLAFDEALAILESLPDEEAQKTRTRVETLVCLIKISDVLRERGDLQGALDRRRRALSIGQSLSEDAPESRMYRRDLTVHYSLMGDSLRDLGEFEEALVHYRGALSLAEVLAQDDAGDSQSQHDLLAALGRVGDALLDLGEHAQALQHYRRMRSIGQALVDGDPTDMTRLRSLEVAHDRMGDVHEARGDREAALEHRRASLEIYEGLVAHDDSVVQWRAGLATAHCSLGTLMQAQGDAEGALVHFESALRIRRALTADSPENARVRDGLAFAYGAIADLLEERGDLDGALERRRRCLEIRKELHAANPSHPTWPGHLAFAHRDLGRLLLRLGEHDDALDHYRSNLELRRDIADRRPADDAAQRSLGIAHSSLAKVLKARGRDAEALAQRRATLAIDQARARRKPGDPAVLRDVAHDRKALADALEGQGDAARALVQLERHLEIRNDLAERSEADDAAQRSLAFAHGYLAGILERQGQHAEAMSYRRRALAVDEVRLAGAPDDVDIRRDVAHDHAYVAACAAALEDYPSASRGYESAARTLEELIEKRPDGEEDQRFLYTYWWDAGWYAYRALHLGAAQRHTRRAVEALVAYGSAHPDSLTWRAALGQLHQILGRILIADGDLKAALAESAESIAACREVLTASPEATSARTNLAWALAYRASVLAAHGWSVESEALIEEALEIAERLQGSAAEGERVLRLLHRVNNALSDMCQLRGEYQRALEYAEAMLDIARRTERAGIGGGLVPTMKVIAYEHIGRGMLYLERPGEAAKAFETAVEHVLRVDERVPARATDLAWMQQSAAGAGRLARGEAAKTALDHLHAAVVEAQLRRSEKALEHMERALADETLRADLSRWALYRAACIAVDLSRQVEDPQRVEALRVRAVDWLREHLAQRKQAAADRPATDPVHDALRRHARYARADDDALLILRPREDFRALFTELAPPR